MVTVPSLCRSCLLWYACHKRGLYKSPCRHYIKDGLFYTLDCERLEEIEREENEHEQQH